MTYLLTSEEKLALAHRKRLREINLRARLEGSGSIDATDFDAIKENHIDGVTTVLASPRVADDFQDALKEVNVVRDPYASVDYITSIRTDIPVLDMTDDELAEFRKYDMRSHPDINISRINYKTK